MSDWQDATDPVPRRELTEAEKREWRAAGYRRRTRPQRLRVELQPWILDEDFDALEA